MSWFKDMKLDLRSIARKHSDVKAVLSGDPKKIARRFVITKPIGRLFGKLLK